MQASFSAPMNTILSRPANASPEMSVKPEGGQVAFSQSLPAVLQLDADSVSACVDGLDERGADPAHRSGLAAGIGS